MKTILGLLILILVLVSCNDKDLLIDVIIIKKYKLTQGVYCAHIVSPVDSNYTIKRDYFLFNCELYQLGDTIKLADDILNPL